MADSFNIKTWETDETITASDLNRMEQGIKSANDRVVVVHPRDQTEFTFNKLLSYLLDNKIVIVDIDSYFNNDGDNNEANCSILKFVFYDSRRQMYLAFTDFVEVVDGPNTATVSLLAFAALSPDALLEGYYGQT